MFCLCAVRGVRAAVCRVQRWPPVSIVFYLVRGIFGGLAVAAVQLLLAMLIRSFAVPIS